MVATAGVVGAAAFGAGFVTSAKVTQPAPNQPAPTTAEVHAAVTTQLTSSSTSDLQNTCELNGRSAAECANAQAAGRGLLMSHMCESLHFCQVCPAVCPAALHMPPPPQPQPPPPHPPPNPQQPQLQPQPPQPSCADNVMLAHVHA